MNDLISRRALCEYALNQKDKNVSPNDIMRFPSAQPAQSYTIHSDGRLWVTVDDIDKVNAVVVDESKSKFCKQFYMDALEPYQGEER